MTAWSLEHTWVVVGFRGKPWRPRAFVIHDSSRTAGVAYRTVSLRAFDDVTRFFRRAVVVRG